MQIPKILVKTLKPTWAEEVLDSEILFKEYRNHTNLTCHVEKPEMEVNLEWNARTMGSVWDLLIPNHSSAEETTVHTGRPNFRNFLILVFFYEGICQVMERWWSVIFLSRQPNECTRRKPATVIKIIFCVVEMLSPSNLYLGEFCIIPRYFVETLWRPTLLFIVIEQAKISEIGPAFFEIVMKILSCEMVNLFEWRP